MKFLVEFSDLNYKTYNYFCENIKKQFPNSTFFAPKPSSFIEEYLKKKISIDYKILKVEKFYRDLVEIDYKYLNYIETNIFKCSLWKIIASDRSLGRSYEHGIRQKDFDFKFKNDRNYLLKYFLFRFKEIDKEFKECKPDFIIPAIAQGSIDTIIYSKLSEFYKSEYAVLNWLRVGNFCTFAHNYELNCYSFDKLSFENSEKEKFNQEVENLFKIVSEKNIKSNTKFNFQLNYFQKYKLFFKVFGFAILFCKAIYASLRDETNRLKNKQIKIKNLFNSVVLNFSGKLNYYYKVLTIKNKYLKTIPDNTKFLYFPLQVQPEYATNIQSTMWTNNRYLIENLSKSIPSDWYIYVKDHPAMTIDRNRPKNYYENLESYPNVKVINIHQNSDELVEKSEMIFTTNGSTAFDAILKGKPVVEIVHNIWSGLGLSTYCSDFEDMNSKIRSELVRADNISKDERDRKIKSYINNIIEYGFELKNLKIAFYNTTGSNEQIEECGKSLAEGLIAYLKKNKKI